MISIPANSGTPTAVFEASFAGIHQFISLGVGGTYRLNAADGLQVPVTGFNPPGQLIFLPLYLNSGDQLFYSGPATSLTGVRLGDELSE